MSVLKHPIKYTIVTALIDLGREEWGEWGRSYDTYLDYFKKVLKIRAPMIIYIDQKSVQWAWDNRPRDLYSHTKIFPIIPQELKVYQHIDKIKDIMSDPTFKEDRVAPDVPEANFPIYNVLVNSKVALLYKASLENTFNSDVLVWLDAGYGHGEDDEWGTTFPLDFEWNLTDMSSDKVTLIQRKNIEESFNDKETFYKAHISAFIGGFMGGTVGAIKKFHDEYYQVLEENLALGYIDQEQTNMLYTFLKNPGVIHAVWGDWYDVFRLFHVDSDLLQKELKADCVFVINLKRKPERREYILNHLEERFKYVKTKPKIQLLEAVDGKNIDEKYLSDYGISVLENYTDPYSGRNMTSGEIGCFMSHYQIWEEVMRQKYQKVIVLEDDAELAEDFVKQYNQAYIDSTKNSGGGGNWQLMYLGRKEVEPDLEKESPGNKLVYPGYSYWTVGYALTYFGAGLLLKANPLENIIPVDEYLPCMYGQQTHDYMNKPWSDKKKLIALSVDPLLVRPKDDAFEESETECSATLNYKTAKDVVCYCVATDATDGYNRFKRSCDIYGIQLKTIGLGEEWKGGDMDAGAGGGHKINLLKEEISKEEDGKIIIFSDSYDVIFCSHSWDIKNKFKSKKCNVLFSAEPFCWPNKSLEGDKRWHKTKSKYKYLNSGGFMGYGKCIKDMLNWKKVEDSYDDQLYYIEYFLEHNKQVNIKLDHDCSLFQVMNGCVDDYDIIYSKGIIKNNVFNTHPCIVHGNGPVNIKMELNNLDNYLARKWNPTYGWLENLETPGKYIHNIFIALIISNPISFYDKVLDSLSKIDYNKKQITLWFHMSQIAYDLYGDMKDHIDKFIKENKKHYLDITFNIGLSDDPIVIKEMSLYNCVLKSSDYYFLINDGIILQNNVLNTLISRKKEIIAPHLDKNNTMWCNFWGCIDYDGNYSRSHDEDQLVTRERMGIWNVSYVDSCYLLNCKLLKKMGNVFRNEHIKEKKNPDEIFCHNLRKAGIFMYFDNFHEYGKVLCCDGFMNWCIDNKEKVHKCISDVIGNQKYWEEEYLHPDYFAYLNKKEDLDIKEPCNDVYSFPLFSDKFCKQIIDIGEQYGHWSGGTGHNNDIRLSGGYENHPTKDIHFTQLSLNDWWNHIVMTYIAPIAHKVYGNYNTKGTNINFIVRYKAEEQAKLEPHHDASSYTANIALNRRGIDYQGGGCRFVRQDFKFYQENAGHCCIHPGKVTHYHEGLPTTDGTRYILVSFID